MEQVVGAALLRQVWGPLFGLDTAPVGPVALQPMPSLALGGACTATGGPMSSILYPAGMRRALLRSLPGRLPRDEGFLPAVDRHKPLDVLEVDLATFTELTRKRQAEVLACLNGLTEQQALLPLLTHLTDDYLDDAGGAHVLYEAARCLVRLGREPQRADALLDAVMRQRSNHQVATMAAIQQGSMRLRQLDDLDGADASMAAAHERLDAFRDDEARGQEAGADCNDPDDRDCHSIALLLESRYQRLLALAHVRRRDGAAVSHAMSLAIEAADGLGRHAVSDDYLLLVVRENSKILCESSIKAAGMRRAAEDLVTWSRRLLEVDPQDPFTWRVIAENAGRCELARAACLAFAGMVALGGPGVHRTLQSVPGGAAPGDASTRDRVRAALDDELVGALHERLTGFYHVD